MVRTGRFFMRFCAISFVGLVVGSLLIHLYRIIASLAHVALLARERDFRKIDFDDVL